jgi:hypothetical protein
MIMETLPNTTASFQRSETCSGETSGLAPPERGESFGAAMLWTLRPYGTEDDYSQ